MSHSASTTPTAYTTVADNAFEEARSWAVAGAQEVVEYCVTNIPPDDVDLEGRWIARLSGQSWALGRFITQTFTLTDEEFDAVTNAWFEIVVAGLMDSGIVGEDRAVTVS